MKTRKLECGCTLVKISKIEVKDYPKGTIEVLDKMCKKHKQEYEKTD